MKKSYTIKSITLLLAFMVLNGCASFFIPPYGHVAKDGGHNKPYKVNIHMPENAPSISQGFKPETSNKTQSLSYEKSRSAAHNGIDIIDAVGTPVLATASGVVISSFFEPFYGNRVILDHGKDASGAYLISNYLHLKKRIVKTGDRVNRGQQIGTLGRTGLLSGGMAHLHFEIRSASTQEQRLTEPLYPHKLWADGYGKVTCFDKTATYPDRPFKTTYPVPCRGIEWQ